MSETAGTTAVFKNEKGKTLGLVNPETGEFEFSVFEDECKVVKTGQIIRVVTYQRLNRISYIERLPAGQYLIKKTGEIKDIQRKAKTRSQNIRYVRQSMQHGRDMVNTNIRNLENCIWVTFTYAENMTDEKRLYLDFKHFNEAYRKKVGKYKYIVAVEPQGRGAWHMHMFMIFDSKPWIDYNEIIKIWGKGRVEVQHMYGDVDNLGAYVSAYLCNLPLQEKAQSEGGHNLNIVTDRDGHMYQKAQRISMYPAGMQIFRYSRGLEKPTEEFISREEAEKKISSAKLTFEKMVQANIETEKGTYTNTYYSKYYIMPDNQNQE